MGGDLAQSGRLPWPHTWVQLFRVALVQFPDR
jgi:hypothetical protein